MDCPQGSPCDHCTTARGIIANMPAEGEHRDREEKWDMLPLFNPKGGAMTGDALYDNIELINFKSDRKTCGERQAAIMPFLQPDYTPFARFENLIFREVSNSAVAFI